MKTFRDLIPGDFIYRNGNEKYVVIKVILVDNNLTIHYRDIIPAYYLMGDPVYEHQYSYNCKISEANVTSYSCYEYFLSSTLETNTVKMLIEKQKIKKIEVLLYKIELLRIELNELTKQ